MNRFFRFHAVLATSLVAGVFSLVVCVLLLLDFAGRGRYELFDSPRYLELKTQLRATPDDEEVQQAIRELDLTLRESYFRRRAFTANGVYLLLGGVALTLVTARWAAALRPVVPQPLVPEEEVDREWRDQRYGKWAAAAVVLGVLGTVTLLAYQAEPLTLLASGEPAAARTPLDQPDGAAPEPAAPADAAAPATPLPSPEQYAQAWPRFRGPTGAGVSAFADIPQQWSGVDNEGVLWKTAVPLPGFNSPIVWEKQVWVCGATADEQAVFCYDADTGELRWRHDVPPDPAVAEQFDAFEATGYAAPTMATDGVRVYAIFATGDVVAINLDGTEQWRKHIGLPNNHYGHASSLATYRDLLLIQLDQGTVKDQQSRLFALRGTDGELAWEVAREVPASWASPIVVEHEGRAMVITAVDPWLIAYSPEDGSELWRAKCLGGEVGPSPVFVDGAVYAANESSGLAVIRADGSGDVTDTHLLWMTDFGAPDVCSPLVTDEFVLLIANGYLACYDRQPAASPDEAKDPRDPLWEEDLGDGVTSSPGLAGSLVYVFSESDEGTVWILQPQRDQCVRVHECQMGEPCRSSPAFQPGRLFIRGDHHLFCIGTASAASP